MYPHFIRTQIHVPKRTLLLFVLVSVLFLVPELCFATLPLNKPLPLLSLEGESGGHLNGASWSSKELRGKVHVIFYVDPDVMEQNDAVRMRLNAEAFSVQQYQFIAIVNLAATWLPNFAIRSKLKSKQKENPSALYLLDKNKSIVKRWGLADDSSDVIVIDKSGKVIFSVDGALTEEQISLLLRTIYENL